MKESIATITTKTYHVVRALWTRIAFAIAIASFVIMIMTLFDRLFGTVFFAEVLSDMNSDTLRNLLTACMDWNHKAVINIGEAARTYIPWNKQDAALYETSSWVFASSLVK